MIDPLIIQIASAVATVAVAWLVAEILIRLISGVARRAGASSDLIRTIREVLSILWIVLAAVLILSIAGIASLFSFLTLSGIVGLAVSLALQNTLSNIISGILLLSWSSAAPRFGCIQWAEGRGSQVRPSFNLDPD